MIAVPPSFVLNKISFEHLKSDNGDESEMPTQRILQHLSSKATFHTTFCGHLPADECPSLSAARCVLLFVITFAIFYHDTCAVFICQDTNTNSAICTFLFPYPQFGLTRITKSSIVNLQTQVNENRYVRSVRQIIWCAIVHVHEYPSLKIKYRQFVLNFDGLFLL